MGIIHNRQSSLFSQKRETGEPVVTNGGVGSARKEDVCQSYHKGDPCSEAANGSIHPQKAAIRLKILEWLRGRGDVGATSDEVEDALKMAHQTVSARMCELVKLGQATKTIKRRPTRSGKPAWVLVAR